MVPISAGISIPFARQLFDEGGAIKDESYDVPASTLLDQPLWWAKALKAARADSPCDSRKPSRLSGKESVFCYEIIDKG